jgi:hypothetical protein
VNDIKKGSSTSNYQPGVSIEDKWTPQCNEAFEELKKRLWTAPVLAPPKYDRPFILYTDASAVAFGAVLFQAWKREDYETSEEEVENMTCNLTIISDDENVLAKGDRQMSEVHVMGDQENVLAAAERWKEGYEKDTAFRGVYAKLKVGKYEDANCYLKSDGVLHFRGSCGDRICLPQSMIKTTLELTHDALGHFGHEKTYTRLAFTFHRPGLAANLHEYMSYCKKCIVNKTSRAKKVGDVMSIDPPGDGGPAGVFDAINMDLILGVPKSDKFDAILV